MEINQNAQAIDTLPRTTKPSIPIVCIGMSAGGIVPVKEIFRTLGSRTGMAFVVIHHLRQEHPTALVSILAKCTEMPVHLASDCTPIQADHVYVLQSGEEIELSDGTFRVHPRSKIFGWSNLVSIFVDSMSRSGHPGIAVILSGLDADGAIALTELKQHGGVVIAQSPLSASSPDMPRAAIRTGSVDYILDPEAIGKTLTTLAEEFGAISHN